MTIQIYNTLSRQKEIFEPIQPGKVNFYVCGPTVYNYIHIGNARSAVAFDTIRRYLEYRGYQVRYISNFTDVDDKIIRAAAQEGVTPKELADKYIAAFEEDTQAIQIKPATLHPRVMDHIPSIIQFVEQLIERGHAYEVEGDVYFDTTSYANYGQLSHQSLDELIVGASQRTESEDTARKQNPVDFALWKGVKDASEIYWDSPWGPGRPGWHIECSVMAMEHLGETIDIHGGGQDLEFPHHENEIAQSESCSGHTFSNYWMHNGFVTIGQDEEKMSKSLGNFVLLRDLLENEDPTVVRYLLTSVHYRRPLKYDQAALDEARSNIERLKEVTRRLNNRLSLAETQLDTDTEWLDRLNQLEVQFVTGMDDDFNVANGLTAVSSLVKTINHYLTQEEVSVAVLQQMQEQLTRWLEIFGIILTEDEAIDQEIEALIEERNQARKDRNFARADEIRDLLKAQGIQLDDTPQGTTWKREG